MTGRPVPAWAWLIAPTVMFPFSATFAGNLGLDPQAPFGWQLWTYLLVHAGVAHLGSNLFLGAVCARANREPTAMFTAVALAASAVAGAVHLWFGSGTLVGASDAVGGVCGFVAVTGSTIRCGTRTWSPRMPLVVFCAATALSATSARSATGVHVGAAVTGVLAGLAVTRRRPTSPAESSTGT